MKKVIILASDHNGIEAKNSIIQFLQKEFNYTCIDFGGYDSSVKTDYVDVAKQVAYNISKEFSKFGILICGTGQGMAITSAKYPNVRPSLCHSTFVAQKAREHNNANILCLGSWISTTEEIKEIVSVWLNEPFGEGRHIPRISKIDKQNGLVLTNGCFDILTKAHISLLKFAKLQGNNLVVAIDSDNRVKELKGDNRPINIENDRKALLESLDCVDEVIIFNSKEELENLYKTICPNVIVRGAEYTVEEIRSRDNIPNDIDIKIFPYIDGISTTNTLKKIQALTTCEKK